jgi:hypothetical protein
MRLRSDPSWFPIRGGVAGCGRGQRFSGFSIAHNLAESPGIVSQTLAHMTGTIDTLLTAASWITPDDKSAYVEFVRTQGEETEDAIRRATRTGRPFGSESFVDMLEFRLNQSLKPRKPGRPRTKLGECP